MVNGKLREFSVGYGGYASAGLLFNVAGGGNVGIVVREQAVELDFNDAVSAYPYDGTQYMVSFGYRL